MVDHTKHRKPGRKPGQAPAPTAKPAPQRPETPDADPERVAKMLARAGVASRREVERLIAEGRVALNGVVLASPAVKVGPSDILTVNGAVVSEKEPTRLWRYHKPVGLITAHKDPKGRPTVFDHLPPGLPRVISIGRLDIASEGLLLLTNDGELARALELPSSGWVRRYRARAYGQTTQEKLDKLMEGLTVEGVRYGAIEAKLDKVRHAAADVDRKGPANIWISVAITEGKNREVRRVLEHIGLKVNRLIRLAYGPFALGVLPVGAAEEVGPRVIREQLEGLIPPEQMPKGERTGGVLMPKGPTPPSRPDKAPAKRAVEAEAKPKKEYKAGWAKPKKKAPSHAPKAAKRSPNAPKAHGTDLTYKTRAPRRPAPKP
jgi:23S rRNA pseudouridine2605 synthase